MAPAGGTATLKYQAMLAARAANPQTAMADDLRRTHSWHRWTYTGSARKWLSPTVNLFGRDCVWQLDGRKDDRSPLRLLAADDHTVLYDVCNAYSDAPSNQVWSASRCDLYAAANLAADLTAAVTHGDGTVRWRSGRGGVGAHLVTHRLNRR